MQLVHIDSIIVGDIVIHNGQPTTVCPHNIKRDAFIGTTLFGDSYNLGTKLVQKVDVSGLEVGKWYQIQMPGYVTNAKWDGSAFNEDGDVWQPSQVLAILTK